MDPLEGGEPSGRSGFDPFLFLRLWLRLPIYVVVSARELLKWLRDYLESDDLARRAQSIDLTIHLSNEAAPEEEADGIWHDLSLGGG